MKSQPTKTAAKTQLKERCSRCQKNKNKTSTLLTQLFAGATCDCIESEKTSTAKERETANLSIELPDLGEQFEALEFLGQGGMGTVFKARNRTDQSIYAVKVMRAELSDDLEAIKRFEQEINAVSKLDHANLIAVHSHGRTRDGATFLIMDYAAGVSLAEHIREVGSLPDKEGLDIFHDLAEALSNAHANGVIHRDIKPGNVLMAENPSGLKTAKLADFGIAKLMPTESSIGRETQDLTKTGDIFGTPNYMSPEQCLGFKLDQRSDIYSLGCLMYEALTGNAPYAGENPIQTVIKQINDAPKQWSIDKGNELRSGLEFVVFRCLEKTPEDRYQNTAELLADLNKLRRGEAVGKRSRESEPKANLSRFQIISLSTLAICCLAYYELLLLGIPVFQGVILLTIPAVLALLYNRRKKLLIPQPENRQWETLRLLTAVLLAVFALGSHFINSGTFEFLPPALQPILLLVTVLQFITLALLSATVIGEFFSGNEHRVPLSAVAKKMLLFAIPGLLISAISLTTCFESTAREIISPIPTRHTSVSFKPTAPRLAETLLRASMAINSNSSKPYEDLGKILSDRKQYDEAEKILKIGVAKNPQKDSSLIELARMHNASGRSAQALAELTARIDRDREKEFNWRSAELYKTRAQIHAERGENELAKKDYSSAIANSWSSTASAFLVERAAISWKEGDQKQAIHDLSQGIKKCSNYDDPDEMYIKRGILNEKMNNPVAAKADFAEAARLIAEDTTNYDQKQMWKYKYDTTASVRARTELLKRSFVSAKTGDAAKSSEDFKMAEELGAKRSDFFTEFSKQFGVQIDW
jgi:eukaryotic-like serine/threonine-protein kinase